ncbi:MAG: Gfo/Idh/MocA family protein [Verrucomicrobiota bacterium]
MSGKKTNEVIRVAVIAAGVRGGHLAQQLAYCMQPAQVVAVAEPDDKRRRCFAQAHDLPNGAQFTSWEDLCNSDLVFDAAIIATLDNLHTAPVLACLRRGCHVLVEKPLANTLQDCLLIEEAQRQAGVIVSVCHTLRYMEAFRRIKQIVQDGLIGRLIHVEHMEAIGHMRFTHNYVRGRWAKEANNTSLLLHKCIHDIDFVAWLVNEPCSRVSSFGSLGYFKPSQAPKGSGKRCLDDCLILNTCPYSALRLYVDGDLTDRIQDLGDTYTREDRLEVVRRGPFGACVWQADNDVVDHQIVSMEFASGTTATCTMTGYSATHGRRTRLQGSEGELLFDEALGSVTIRKFSNPKPEIIRIQPTDSYHPEDREIVANWLSAIHDSSNGVIVNAQEATKTHAIVFAAERSRIEKRTIEMSEHMKPITE